MYEDTIMYRLTSEQASGIEPSYERDLSQRNYTAHTHTHTRYHSAKRKNARTHARTHEQHEGKGRQAKVGEWHNVRLDISSQRVWSLARAREIERGERANSGYYQATRVGCVSVR